MLCSNCFTDEGLKIDAFQIGVENKQKCKNCGTINGRKLDKSHIQNLAYRFFVRGTFNRTEYGGAPIVQFNERQYGQNQIQFSAWLQKDVKLIEEAINIGFFFYGPRLWMVGEVKPLKSLLEPSRRKEIIKTILSGYPKRQLSTRDSFYRLRKNPKSPEKPSEYDSPPKEFLGTYRLDSAQLPILYASQDLEVCIHECRVTVEDDLFIGTLAPKESLSLLDLTEVLDENATEFESLDMAIHMLFCATSHSYNISRDIALAAQEAKFDGVIYPSYFSHIRTGEVPFDTVYGLSVRSFPSYKAQTIPNIALFGRPIECGKVEVQCINRLVLNKISYGFQFGPVETPAIKEQEEKFQECSGVPSD